MPSAPSPSRRRLKPQELVARLNDSDLMVNLGGDYRYLSAPYYESQDFEVSGRDVRPACKDALDAYIVPIMLEKARMAGIPVPTWYITNDYFEPPVVVDTVNPFMSRHRRVLSQRQQDSVARSLTRNFTYSICCQEIPSGARVSSFRAVLGWAANKSFRDLAWGVWEVFRIPLADVRVLVQSGMPPLLSAIRPLPFDQLKAREREHLAKVVQWPT